MKILIDERTAAQIAEDFEIEVKFDFTKPHVWVALADCEHGSTLWVSSSKNKAIELLVDKYSLEEDQADDLLTEEIVFTENNVYSVSSEYILD